MQIQIIITGGTIDSLWSGAKDTVEVASYSFLPEYFDELKRNLEFYDEVNFSEVCMKDSREISEDDRKNMVQAIEECNADKIILTHGTYTMPDTARFINDNLKRKDQTIVLTGSMVPLKGFYFSDAPFNLGFAYAQVNTLKPGVYVCMNAKVFTPREVAKNIEEGKFYSIFKEEQ